MFSVLKNSELELSRGSCLAQLFIVVIPITRWFHDKAHAGAEAIGLKILKIYIKMLNDVNPHHLKYKRRVYSLGMKF